MSKIACIKTDREGKAKQRQEKERATQSKIFGERGKMDRETRREMREREKKR